MEAVERKSHAIELFAGLPERYDLLSSVLSFGQDPRWRRVARHAAAPSGPGDRVLDVATGHRDGRASSSARRGCRVVGLDQSERDARRRRDAETRATAASAADPVRSGPRPSGCRSPDGEFDALTFTYLLRYVDDPAATLRELARVVTPGGTIANLEFASRQAGLARALWSAVHAGRAAALGRLASRDWYEVGRFLGPSIIGLLRRYPLSHSAGDVARGRARRRPRAAR